MPNTLMKIQEFNIFMIIYQNRLNESNFCYIIKIKLSYFLLNERKFLSERNYGFLNIDRLKIGDRKYFSHFLDVE